MRMYNKKVKSTLVVLVGILCLSQSLAQSPTITETLKNLQQESKTQDQLRNEELRRLEEEKERLRKRLLETDQKITEIQSVHNSEKKSEYILSAEKIDQVMTTKKFGSCVIMAGESEREYFITKRGIKIRFVFLSKDDKLAPKSVLVKNDQGQELVQIEQPGFNPTQIQSEGDMYSMIRFTEQDVDIHHAVFHGQRVEDKWFGRSSFEPFVVTCKL